MKYFMCFAVIVAVIGVACAHPGFAAVAAAGSAAVSGAAENGDAAKNLNPLAVGAEITKFMDTIKEACEKFFQGILGGTKLFNPLDVGKNILKMKSNIIGNILKDFGGAPDQKDAAAAAASSAASAATPTGTSAAAAASGAAAETGDATKNSNPLIEAEISKFMATIEEACEKFVQGIFGGSGASPLGALPAGTPGMSKLFNPIGVSKNIFGNILKDFGGADASPSDQKVASAAAAGSASAAIAKKKSEAVVAPVKATTGKPDMLASMENAGSQAFSDLFGDFGF